MRRQRNKRSKGYSPRYHVAGIWYIDGSSDLSYLICDNKTKEAVANINILGGGKIGLVFNPEINNKIHEGGIMRFAREYGEHLQAIADGLKADNVDPSSTAFIVGAAIGTILNARGISRCTHDIFKPAP